MSGKNLEGNDRQSAHADDLYRQISDAIPHMVWVGRADGWLEYCNARVHEYTGLDMAQFEGWNWRRVVHPEDLLRWESAWREALARDEHFSIDCRMQRADGVYRWHSGSARPMRDARGTVTRWCGTYTDIEEQVSSARRLEQMLSAHTRALSESERRFRSFMDYAPAVAWIKDAQLRYVYVSRRYEEAFGMRLEDLRGRQDFEVWPEEVAAAGRRGDEVARLEPGSHQAIIKLPVAGGKTAEWFAVKFPFPDANGGPGVAGIAIDFTAQSRLREALGKSGERVRRLLDRLVIAQEAERRRLADGLHDLIGQNLTALGIGLGVLEATLPREVAASTEARLGDMRRLVEATVAEIRGVMTELRPPALEEYGLMPALRQHAAEFEQRTGIRTSVATACGETRLAREIELALFRITQESLTNVAKHAAASQVQIELSISDTLAHLAISDDGSGFAEPEGARAAGRGGWGLPAMRERCEALGGALRIGFPGRGTRLEVDIPLPGCPDDRMTG